MIKKAFATAKEVKEFKKGYSSGDIITEVISNLIQPFYEEKNIAIKKYCDFWGPKDNNLFKLTSVMRFMVEHYASHALEESFGKYDFKFEGNRTYKNYVLDFDGLTVVGPAKREVVLQGKEIDYEKIVRFEKEYTQFVLGFILKNHKDLADYEKEGLKELKDKGLIKEDKIDFEYFETKPKMKKP